MTQKRILSLEKVPENKQLSDPVSKVCIEIMERLPEPFDTDSAAEKYPIEYKNSINTVLRQELVRFNQLIAFIKVSLKDVHRAIVGQIVMIPELEKTYQEMFESKIPDSWKKKSYPSLKPLGSYISDLLARIKFLKNWIDHGEPMVFWFSGFFFTQCFLTGVLQNHSRKNNLPIDNLDMKFEIIRFERHELEKPEVGVYIQVNHFTF